MNYRGTFVNSRGRAANLLVAFLSVVFLLATLEGVLRATHLFGARVSWARPDSVLGWRFVPGAPYWYHKESERPVTGTINRFGWKDKDWDLTKPEGVYRAAVLGDSYVEAFQVDEERNFLNLTQETVSRDSGRRLEMMNFGRSAATQSEELLILEKDAAPFQPDMVILFFFPPNDISDIARPTALGTLRPFYREDQDGKLVLDTSFNRTWAYRVRSWVSRLKNHSALVSLLAERYTAFQIQRGIYKRHSSFPHGFRRESDPRLKRSGMTEGELKSADSIRGYLSLCTARPEAGYLENYRLNKRLIREMAGFCRGRGIRFLLAVIDIPAALPEVEAYYRKMDSSFNPFFFDDDLAAFAGELGVESVGLGRIFRRVYLETGDSLHWAGRGGEAAAASQGREIHTGHWNERGHEIVSRVLAEKLVQPSLNSRRDASSVIPEIFYPGSMDSGFRRNDELSTNLSKSVLEKN